MGSGRGSGKGRAEKIRPGRNRNAGGCRWRRRGRVGAIRSALDGFVCYRQTRAVKLIFERAAAKALRRMPSRDAAAILDRFDQIAAAPFARHPDCRPLVGIRDGYRLRHGDWRALYRIDRQARVIHVEDVKHRREAYR